MRDQWDALSGRPSAAQPMSRVPLYSEDGRSRRAPKIVVTAGQPNLEFCIQIVTVVSPPCSYTGTCSRSLDRLAYAALHRCPKSRVGLPAVRKTHVLTVSDDI
jgi:hypothetical protein